MKQKIVTFFEGIFFVTFFLSMSAMDSEAWIVPAIGLVVSAMGLLVTHRWEIKRGWNE